MSNRGHNENAVRLSMLADNAQRGLAQVAKGEDDAIEGWLAYGAALNEGRSLFPGDREFGRWLKESVQSQVAIGADEQAAAIWAAANRDQFDEARSAGKARTVRGIHAKWKEIEAEREKARIEAERKAEEERRRAEAALDRNEDQAATEGGDDAIFDGGSQPDQKSLPASAPAQPVVTQAEPDAGEPASAAPDTAPSDADQNEISADEAKERRELAKLTDEALIDEVIGLRSENADLRKERDALKREIDDFKSTLRDMSSDNKDAVSSRLRDKLRSAEYRRDEAMSEVKRMEYRLKKAEERVAELESMGIEIAV